MNFYPKPSFSSTLLHRMKSLFECFMSQDVQLIDFDNYKVPYLLTHDYDDADSETDYLSDYSSGSSESSEIPLLEVKRVSDGKRSRMILIENERMSNDKRLKEEQRPLNRSSSGLLNKPPHRSPNKPPNRSPSKPPSRPPAQKPVGLRSSVFKLDGQRENQLFTSLSGKFKSWSIQTKEKYVDGLVRTAMMYMRLKDYDRAESVLFEALDFYLDKFVKIEKAIETLSLLDTIYSELGRYLEQIEVNKLILNIAGANSEAVKRSAGKVVQAYRRMNLEDKAQKFIEEYNKKLDKK